MTPTASEPLEIALDRGAEVPIGVQLAWALRTRIRGGALAAGERLPTLQRLAEQLAVNVNTVRAVYARLEREGLVETRHGSGTYVVGGAGERASLDQLAAGAARAARDAGLDPRDVAAALYVRAGEPGPPDSAAARRRDLRAQIATLEQALADLLARRPDLAAGAGPASPAPHLPSAAELERQRANLLRRLAEVQAEVEAPLAPRPG